MTGEAVALGIDLAWSARRTSGCVAVDSEGRMIDEQLLGGDAEVLDWVDRLAATEAVIAVDAPLRVTNETGRRACESEVSSHYGGRGASTHSSNRTLLSRVHGAVRGDELCRELCARGFRDPWAQSDRTVIEVYPHPALIEMFGLDYRLRYKKGRVAERRAGLRRLDQLIGRLSHADPAVHFTELGVSDLMRGRELKDVEDMLDARVCAWLAMSWRTHGAERMRLFGSAEGGHIAVPSGRACHDDTFSSGG